MTSNEFELLWILADAAGTILDRDFLFKALRGIEYDGLDRTIDVTVSRLRKKLGESEIPAKIKELQVHFGYPLAVQKSSSLALNQEETAIFSQDKVIVRNEDSPESLYLQRLPGSDNAMIMGPFAECNVGIMDHVVGFITVGAFMTIFSLAWPFISGASSA